MDDEPKRPTRDVLLGLLMATGWLLNASALPVGVLFGLIWFLQLRLGKWEAILVGLALAGAMIAIGLVSLNFGKFLFKRRTV
jgi:hypothetical protein